MDASSNPVVASREGNKMVAFVATAVVVSFGFGFLIGRIWTPSATSEQKPAQVLSAAKAPMADTMESATQELPGINPTTSQSANDAVTEPIVKAKGPSSFRIAELFHSGKSIGGKTVQVRGKVVKVNSVMGKNYAHLRDGTGAAEKGDHDLTVVTTEDVSSDEVLTFEGQAEVEKDLGMGRIYPIVLSSARVIGR